MEDARPSQTSAPVRAHSAISNPSLQRRVRTLQRGASHVFLAVVWAAIVLFAIEQNAPGVAVLGVGAWLATTIGVRHTHAMADRATGAGAEIRRLRGEVSLARSTDSLTGLLDRRATLAGVRCAMDMGHGVGLLYVDLDDFAVVNERFGHAVGDQVLINVAARLSEITRPADLVGRTGNDEFVIVLTDPADLHLTDVIADRVAGEIARCHGPIAELSITASVGSVLSLEGLTAEDVLGCADTAMTRAKLNGGNAAETFLARNSG